MGDLNVRHVSSHAQLNDFTKHLLKDVEALDFMINNGWFENGNIHLGAEQEICLIDKHFKPAPLAMDVLDHLPDNFTTELAKFNVEANIEPFPFSGDCFSKLENRINELLGQLRQVAHEKGIDFVITGILPTIRKFDLELDNITPLERYYALIKAIENLRGKIHELRIKGMDELNVKHDSAMLEACNTSFQVHLQVSPDEFVQKYNIAQLITAPVLAVASNSPMLFGKRLWSETRIALFQQSLDTRITSEHLRDRSPRVTFGNSWLKNSILDLYKEDIVRFRVMLMSDPEQDVFELIEQGITPKLRALTIHNSTVYRWNRPCYGISPSGKPHLRIENRVLPAGPTVLDEVANAAFWLGLMSGFGDHYPNVPSLIDFDYAKSNYISTAFSGLHSELKWFNGKKIGVCELIRKELLPIAREGLEKRKVEKKDIDKYLSIIEERIDAEQNGTLWVLKSHAKLNKQMGKEEMSVLLTSSMLKNQKSGLPVHKWQLADINDLYEYHPHGILVEEFMTTDLFTVYKDDLPELVSDVMDWQRIRFTPVEDEKGQLVGLLSSRILMRFFSQQYKLDRREDKTVKDLMIKNPITISPESTIFEAMSIMEGNKIGCLPVVKNDKLIGIITEGNFLGITASLLKVLNKNAK
ncbi:CBS domain-containing protein [Fulvivirga sp. M361]|uniref:glutamate-cysteine ligase family protein n=1 Tax=Fulvivirga sp. M361 TaxID=2594266 RepID=UPI00117BA647|nr:glutamate-cysteine ligase family protein [Fulvivirga sp. M361]TRX51418.1 CBS domain-containing protein [Fulvivirga sp. M361]